MLELLVMVALVALIILTIVLLARGSAVALPARKFSLKTHFVNELQVPAHVSPEAAGLTPREGMTQTEVPNLNQNVSGVFDQGSLGSCVANALTSAFDQVDTSPVGSRLFLQQNARSLVGNVRGDTGTTLQAGIQALQRWGLAQENAWPYLVNRYRNKPSANAQNQAKTNRVVQAQRVAVGSDSIRNWISRGQPVAVGLLLYRSFYKADTTGIVPMPRAGESLLGGHAVLIVGFDDTLKRFKVRNSWGTSWGLGGYFWLPQDYITNNRASDFWVITSTT